MVKYISALCIIVVGIYSSDTVIRPSIVSKEAIIRQKFDSLMVSELEKDIVEVTENWHPEIEKYFISAGVNPKSRYSWCGFMLHYRNTSFGIEGKGGWAASWPAKDVLRTYPQMGDGYAIPRSGGSGMHVGHVHLVKLGYVYVIDGNISNRVLKRKITLDKQGLKFFSYIKKSLDNGD